MNARPDTDLFEVVTLRRRENGARSAGLRLFAKAVTKLATDEGWNVAALGSADALRPDLLLVRDAGCDGRVIAAVLLESDAAGLERGHARWIFPLFVSGVRLAVWREGQDLDAIRQELADVAEEMETA